MFRAKLKTDVTLFLCVSFLSAIGLLALFSATQNENTNRFFVQCISIGLGLLAYVLLAFIDFRGGIRYSNFLYVFCVASLLFVLFFGMGKDTHGASSWIRIGPFGIQPSEPIKILFALVFSKKIADCVENKTLNRPKIFCFLCVQFLVLFALLILQNDTGTALVYLFMFFIMLYFAGLSKTYFFIGTGLCLFAIPVIWMMLSGYQKARILTFLNPARDALGAGFQVTQSKLTIGSGKFFGRGFMKGPQTRMGMLPESETDFIFAVISEEFGFFGSVVTVVLLFLLVFRVFTLAKRAKTQEARLVLYSLSAMFFFHSLENISMCLGLLPVTGIPLPFLSYGGSAMLTNYAAIGVISNIYRNKL